MGNSNYSAEKNLPQTWIQVFNALKLHKREIKKLHKVFRNIDTDSDGSVDVGDILSILDIERTKFTERIFASYDTNHTGTVDFRGFVLCLWNYCSLGKGSLSESLCAFRYQVCINTLACTVHWRKVIAEFTPVSFIPFTDYFTFDLYDWDESGDLSTDQIHQMIWDFFGENLDGNPQARA